MADVLIVKVKSVALLFWLCTISWSLVGNAAVGEKGECEWGFKSVLMQQKQGSWGCYSGFECMAGSYGMLLHAARSERLEVRQWAEEQGCPRDRCMPNGLKTKLLVNSCYVLL
jgi:hypothetical protein